MHGTCSPPLDTTRSRLTAPSFERTLVFRGSVQPPHEVIDTAPASDTFTHTEKAPPPSGAPALVSMYSTRLFEHLVVTGLVTAGVVDDAFAFAFAFLLVVLVLLVLLVLLGLVSASALPVAAVVEAPLVEAPLVEAPVVEAPLVEAPLVEAPLVEAPRADESGASAPLVAPPAGDLPTSPGALDKLRLSPMMRASAAAASTTTTATTIVHERFFSGADRTTRPACSALPATAASLAAAGLKAPSGSVASPSSALA